jgi:DNA-binding transcriptional LysR family regulator
VNPIVRGYDSSAGYDLVGLRYVQTIAACRSMTAAAKLLRVSQPTLTVAVRTLEGRLGTSLFLRGPRGVVPTASGEALVRAGEQVFTLLRQVDEEIRGIESVPAGRFVIGSYHSFGAFFLPALLEDLAVRAPAIELSLWEGTGPQLRDAVVDRTLHFGIDAGLEARPHPDLVIVPMFRDVMTVVSAPKRPPKGAPLFHVPRIPSSERVITAMCAQGCLPERLVPCGDLEIVKSHVLHGAGTGILPWRVATNGTARGALRLAGPALPFEVDIGSLFFRVDLHRTRGALRVRDEILRRGKALDAVPMPLGVSPLGARGRR